jgi:hypothetical protein
MFALKEGIFGALFIKTKKFTYSANLTYKTLEIWKFSIFTHFLIKNEII